VIRPRRRRQSDHDTPESTALARRLAGLKDDVRAAMSKITEADKAIDEWEKQHRGTSPA
jgi:hypothetical protein